MPRVRRSRPLHSPEAPATEVRLHLTDMAHQGEALGRIDGQVAFISYGIPGEEVRVRVETEKRQYLTGVVSEVVTPSPHRVEPRCPHFGSCGGCQLQHVDYSHQLELKRRVVAEQMRHIGKLIDPPLRPTLPYDNPWHYRNHARFTATREGRAGFTYRNTHRVIPIDWCYIMQPWINNAKTALESAAAGRHQLALRYGVNSGDYLIHPSLPTSDAAYETGQTAYVERLYGVPFRVSAPSFFQVNTQQAERIVGLVRDGLELCGTDTLVDAYAGVGTFTALLAPFVRRVVAIEESRAAVRDARENLAGLSHVEIVEAKTEEALDRLVDRPDAVILDPPRAGCDPRVLDALGNLRPRRLVYVSCDPATLARDLRLLVLGGYRLLEIQPVDMFPQTYHIEIVATLAPMEPDDLLLASTSPQRRELLPALDLPFQVLVPPANEAELSFDGTPEEVAVSLALAKAFSIAQEAAAGTVVAADTIVVTGDTVLGKPRDTEEALAMLRQLRGREHRVVTGVAVVGAKGDALVMDARSTTVRMRSYTDAELETYVASGEALDKAGAYAIQDPGFRPVQSVDGCPVNVVGLPLCTLAALLEQSGLRPASAGERTATGQCTLCHNMTLPLEEGA